MDTNKLEELKTQMDSHKNIKKKLDKLNNDINTKVKQRTLVEKSINYEKVLRKFPSQAIGSVALYNKLNENYSFFDEVQFNKIIRFVQHIEEKEKRYRGLYVDCTSGYINNLDTIPIKELKKEQKELKISYQLLSILSYEVNGDIVSFNKVYNMLEDSGIFMSVPEKKNQEYLSQISTKLDNVMKGLKAVFDSLQETNRKLEEISQEMSYIASGIDDISSDLWDISFDLSIQ